MALDFKKENTSPFSNPVTLYVSKSISNAEKEEGPLRPLPGLKVNSSAQTQPAETPKRPGSSAGLRPPRVGSAGLVKRRPGTAASRVTPLRPQTAGPGVHSPVTPKNASASVKLQKLDRFMTAPGRPRTAGTASQRTSWTPSYVNTSRSSHITARSTGPTSPKISLDETREMVKTVRGEINDYVQKGEVPADTASKIEYVVCRMAMDMEELHQFNEKVADSDTGNTSHCNLLVMLAQQEVKRLRKKLKTESKLKDKAIKKLNETRLRHGGQSEPIESLWEEQYYSLHHDLLDLTRENQLLKKTFTGLGLAKVPFGYMNYDPLASANMDPDVNDTLTTNDEGEVSSGSDEETQEAKRAAKRRGSLTALQSDLKRSNAGGSKDVRFLSADHTPQKVASTGPASSPGASSGVGTSLADFGFKEWRDGATSVLTERVLLHLSESIRRQGKEGAEKRIAEMQDEVNELRQKYEEERATALANKDALEARAQKAEEKLKEYMDNNMKRGPNVQVNTRRTSVQPEGGFAVTTNVPPTPGTTRQASKGEDPQLSDFHIVRPNNFTSIQHQYVDPASGTWIMREKDEKLNYNLEKQGSILESLDKTISEIEAKNEETQEIVGRFTDAFKDTCMLEEWQIPRNVSMYRPKVRMRKIIARAEIVKKREEFCKATSLTDKELDMVMNVLEHFGNSDMTIDFDKVPDILRECGCTESQDRLKVVVQTWKQAIGDPAAKYFDVLQFLSNPDIQQMLMVDRNTRLSRRQMKRLHTVFKQYEPEDGMLRSRNLKDALDAIGIILDIAEIEALMVQVEGEHMGKLSIDELMRSRELGKLVEMDDEVMMHKGQVIYILRVITNMSRNEGKKDLNEQSIRLLELLRTYGWEVPMDEAQKLIIRARMENIHRKDIKALVDAGIYMKSEPTTGGLNSRILILHGPDGFYHRIPVGRSLVDVGSLVDVCQYKFDGDDMSLLLSAVMMVCMRRHYEQQALVDEMVTKEGFAAWNRPFPYADCKSVAIQLSMPASDVAVQTDDTEDDKERRIQRAAGLKTPLIWRNLMGGSPSEDHALPIRMLLNTIHELYFEKLVDDQEQDLNKLKRSNMEKYVAETFLTKYSNKTQVTKKLAETYNGVKENIRKSLRVQMFAAFCGIVGNENLASLEALNFFMKILGRVKGLVRLTEDSLWTINFGFVPDLVKQFMGWFTEDELIEFIERLELLHSENPSTQLSSYKEERKSTDVDFDRVMELIMDEYLACLHSIDKRAVALFKEYDEDGDGNLTFDEFRNMCEGTRPEDPPKAKKIMQMYYDALNGFKKETMLPEDFARIVRSYELITIADLVELQRKRREEQELENLRLEQQKEQELQEARARESKSKRLQKEMARRGLDADDNADDRSRTKPGAGAE